VSLHSSGPGRSGRRGLIDKLPGGRRSRSGRRPGRAGIVRAGPSHFPRTRRPSGIAGTLADLASLERNKRSYPMRNPCSGNLGIFQEPEHKRALPACSRVFLHARQLLNLKQSVESGGQAQRPRCAKILALRCRPRNKPNWKARSRRHGWH
jgi:hypothetical protein